MTCTYELGIFGPIVFVSIFSHIFSSVYVVSCPYTYILSLTFKGGTGSTVLIFPNG